LLITYEYAGFNDMTYEGVLNMIGDGDVFREVSPEIGANCEDICSYQGGSLYSCLFGMKEGNIGGASYSSLTTCNSYITTEEIPMALSCMCARSP
jgi:hypothetical protein